MRFVYSTIRPDPRRSPALGAVALVAVAWLGVTGCDREGVRQYQAPKGTASAASTPPAGMMTPEPSAGVPHVKWQLPAGWQELPAGQMRVGSFAVTGENGQKADVSIIPLPGLAGSDLDNVNRWLGQLGAAPITADELGKLAEKVGVGGSEGQLFDLAGPADQKPRKRMLAAILRREGTAWFFKMTGDDALVTQQKPAYVSFLKTLTFGPAAAAGAPAGAATAPAAPPPLLTPAQMPAPTAGKPAFTVPATWKEEAPGPMQVVKYVPEGAAGKADITVVVLPGDGGGELANINRWRRQLGLEPTTETDPAKLATALKIEGAQGYLVDITNDASQRRMIAAAVTRGGQTWFYKLTGETAVAEKEKAAFIQFVETAKYAL